MARKWVIMLVLKNPQAEAWRIWDVDAVIKKQQTVSNGPFWVGWLGMLGGCDGVCGICVADVFV
jgi:hypothetical protein